MSTSLALALLVLALLAASARLLGGLPRGGAGAATTLRAGLLLLVAATLTLATLRRQGLTHVVGVGLVTPERPIDAPVPARRAGLEPRPPLARDLTILLLDGLRVDAAEASPAWRALAPRGARLRARLRFPVKSAAGRSLLITGAPAEVTGVLGNVTSTRGDTDHLLRRAAEAGFDVLDADWPSWLGLAPTGPRAPATGGAARRLVVQDLFACDEAGHAVGSLSDEYRAAVALDSEYVLLAAARADLSRTAILALADHGHLDRGGHSGLEPEVATAPVLLLGAGVRAGFARDEPVAMEDVNATLSVLLGLPPPDLARGVPVLDALDVPPADAPALRAAFEARRDDLDAAWEAAVQPARVRALRALGALLALALVLLALGPTLDRTLALAACGPVVAAALRLAVGPPVSGDARWAPPEHAAIVSLALLLSVLALRAARADLERASRALLAAWSIPACVLLGICGLGPAGLPPTPWAYGLAVASFGLCAAAVTVGMGLVLSEHAPVRAHRP